MEPEEVLKLEGYLQSLFSMPAIEVLRHPQGGTAEVIIGDRTIGKLARDEDDDDLSYSYQMAIREQDYEHYLRSLFPLPAMEMRSRPQKDDSAEFYVNDEFVGVLFKSDDNSDVLYWLEIAILEFDLED